MLFYEGKNYLLCNLNKESKWQVPLDITLEENSEIAFACNGNGHVHLTGYLIPSSDDDYEDVVSDGYQKKKQDKTSILNDRNSKRKATDSPKSPKQAKRVKQETEESSDDDEYLEMEDDSEDDTEDSECEGELLGEEQEEDDSDEDEEDDEDDDEEEEVQEYEQKKVAKPQQLEKKSKQSQEQQQQKKKQDKQKTINGKEVRQEQQKQQKKNKTEQQTQQNAQNEAKKAVIEGGVQVEELKVGQGAQVKSGKFISVYYIGRLKNGKKFDATTQGDGFKFRLGKGEVIKGWDVGIAGMKVGGKRRITIPPNMAYVYSLYFTIIQFFMFALPHVLLSISIFLLEIFLNYFEVMND